jgi:K+-sensing histidine kinase KdpD
MKKQTKIILSVLAFVIMVIIYEYFIYLWAANESTAVIRVDIFLVYPVFLAISVVVYYLLGKIGHNENEINSK